MPERNHLSTADFLAWAGTSKHPRSLPNVLGWRQYILSLNNTGKFVPGTYRCNSNRIFQVEAGCEATFMTQKIAGLEYGLSGDVAAHLFGQSVATCLGDLTPAWDTFLEKEAVNKSYAKIANSDLDVGVMIGELRETVEGLRNPLSALRKEVEWLKKNHNKLLNLEDALQTAGYFKTLRISDSIDRLQKRLALGGLPRTANALAGTWLEWRYGIRPLIKQVEDIIEHVNSRSREFSVKLQRRKGKTSTITKVETGSATLSAAIFNVYGHFRKETKTWTVARTAFTMPYPVTWQYRYGLDYSSIPGIAWELLPLSFVADWFVGVGSWLAALRVLANPAVLHGTSVTQRSDVTIDGWIDQIKYGATVMNTSSPGSHSWSLRSMQRKCLSPGFNAYTPSLNSKALKLQQQIDALALSWQRLPNLKSLLRRN